MLPDAVLTALIVAVIGPVILFALNRIFGGRRRDDTDHEAKVAGLWESWSKEQGARITALEKDVAELKQQLAEERRISEGLQDQNRRQASLLTDLIRWAIQLRDEILKLGGTVPPAPIAVEAALTNLDPPR